MAQPSDKAVILLDNDAVECGIALTSAEGNSLPPASRCITTSHAGSWSRSATRPDPAGCTLAGNLAHAGVRRHLETNRGVTRRLDQRMRPTIKTERAARLLVLEPWAIFRPVDDAVHDTLRPRLVTIRRGLVASCQYGTDGSEFRYSSRSASVGSSLAARSAGR